MLVAARVLGLLAGAWWTFFGLACGSEQGVVGALVHALPGLLILATSWLSWHHPIVAGVLFVVEAMAVVAFLSRHPFVMMTMVLPLVTAGVLAIVAALKR